jgi:hypothetical protein
MKMTHQWIKKQIADYKVLLSSLKPVEEDRKLYTIWNQTLVTLESVLTVIELEMAA